MTNKVDTHVADSRVSLDRWEGLVGYGGGGRSKQVVEESALRD